MAEATMIYLILLLFIVVCLLSYLVYKLDKLNDAMILLIQGYMRLNNEFNNLVELASKYKDT